MKDRILQILAWIVAIGFALFFCYLMILESKADELEITQILYDQVEIREING
jgi:hypothetical protein